MYTLLSSGLTATASAPPNHRPVVQPVSGVFVKQPAPPVSCVSDPTEGSRASTSTALLPGAAAYTLLPSPLTASPSIFDIASPLVHLPAPPCEMHPPVPKSCFSAPP